MTVTVAEQGADPPAPPVAAPAERVPRLRLVRYEPEPGDDPPQPPSPRPVVPAAAIPAVGPDRVVRQVTAHVLRIALEVLDGRRPLAHLGRHLDAPALRYWRAAVGAGSARPVTPSQVRRILLCQPCVGVAEVSAVCRIHGRTRALAARFEAADGGWRCTVLRLG